VNKALQRWAKLHTGRTDLTFAWDPSVEDPALKEMLEARQSMAEESYLIGASDDAIQSHASAQVLDDLLAITRTRPQGSPSH
jgi:hypothetical protein